MKKVPTSYMHWRSSQGFSADQVEHLYLSYDEDERKYHELVVWLHSHEIANNDKFRPTIEALITAQQNLIERHDRFTRQFAPVILVALPSISTTTDLAFTGHYDSALILLRSTVEGILRITLNVVEHFSEELSDCLEGMNDDWKDAMRIEGAHTIGKMCNSLKKMKLTKPLRNPYRYLEIDELNYLTHANIQPMHDSDDNIITSGQFKTFDQDKFDNYVEMHKRIAETILIIWQNLLDYIDPITEPLLTPSEHFPMLSELVENRT